MLAVTGCMPTAWIEAQRVLDCSSSRRVGASRFWKLMRRQSPTFMRSTIGRGRLPGAELDVAGGERRAADRHHVAPQGEHHALRLDRAEAVPEEDLVESDHVRDHRVGA